MRPAVVTTIKNVVVPTEHGASVMLGESLLAGWLISFSGKSFLPALGWLFLFFMSNPLKICIKDISHHVFTTRTSVAVYFCTGFGILSLAAFRSAYALSGPSFLFVLIGVIPLGVIHLWSVVTAGKKELIAELSGALSLGGVAASIVLAAGHPYSQALTLWAVLAVRAMTSVIYVRERLSKIRGNVKNYALVIQAHIVGGVILGLLVLSHLVKPSILIAGLLLVLRLWFMQQNKLITAKKLGLQELILGILYVVAAVFSF